MKVIEVKVIFDSDDIDKYQKKICDLFYSFGVTGLKIEEPLRKKNPLDYYKDEKAFFMRNHAVSAYFPKNMYVKKRQDLLLEVFAKNFANEEDMIYTLEFYEYEEEDYQNSWKKYLFPVKISKKIVVKPTWRKYEVQEGELVIELDPGRAFGTGSHPTTSLCVDLMEDYIEEGESVLDVGTGSGILMIAAYKLGANFVSGIDIDELAVEAAQENLVRNEIPKEFYQVLQGNLLDKVKEKSYDVVVANILADVLILLAQDISKVVKQNGKIIFSGIIDEKLEEVKKEVQKLGLQIEKIIEKGEWRALLLRS